ncbi:MAG: hypothetical protein EPN23_04725 [Verrucomicrobia bacterium]|nr:MAG: hypothetical protein EPN23_04725 [Verrucomicrobiota bacterium]
MRVWKTILGTGLVTLAVWLLFAWPLPAHVATVVPSSAHHAPTDFQPTIPGDHLQFMYYCWLAGDWLTGHTPFFYNLYEFNTGDPRACFHPDTYYIPFSLIFNASAALGGRAFGWNLTGFLSLWLTYLFTLLLTRRYTTSEWIAWWVALISIIMPFRWVNLFGGSPAGFAMMWTPAVLLGIDLAIRENRLAGGWLAGFAILGAAWGDQHVFFFSALAAVGWCCVAFAARTERPWLSWRYVGRCLLALLPFLLFLAFALKFPKLMKWLTHFVTGVPAVDFSVGPRHWREVLNYSPEWPGYWGRSPLAISDQIFIGYTICAVLLAGWFALLGRTVRAFRADARHWLVLTLLGAGIVVVLYLALGYRAPFDARFFNLARKLIPPYGFIRQPAKILSVLPTLLAVGAALSLGALMPLLRNRRLQLALPTLVLALLIWEYAGQTHPTLARLDDRQEAYAAVATDAQKLGQPPHALVIVLWPGDSHYSSLYQHYASLYRVRMVNGYNPFIKKNYFLDIFRRFESVNQGVLSDEQIARLDTMGVHWLLFHENLFPEKVSPFPAACTLQNLLRHPRLKLLKQDGPVWAFRILNAGSETRPTGDACRPGLRPGATVPDFQGLEKPADHFSKPRETFFPARQWELERCPRSESCALQADEGASARAYALLAYTNAAVEIPSERVAFRPTLRWLLRARGQGVLDCAQIVNSQPCVTNGLSISATNWTWYAVPAVAFLGFAPVGLNLRYASGSVDLDFALLLDGDWSSPVKGQTLELPGAIFFHAGMTDLANGSAVFRVQHDGAGISFYGPKLPLEVGDYRVAVEAASPAAPGTDLGAFNLDQGTTMLASASVIAGQPAQVRIHIVRNLPINLVFVYSGKADVVLRRVSFARVE